MGGNLAALALGGGEEKLILIAESASEGEASVEGKAARTQEAGDAVTSAHEAVARGGAREERSVVVGEDAVAVGAGFVAWDWAGIGPAGVLTAATSEKVATEFLASELFDLGFFSGFSFLARLFDHRGFFVEGDPATLIFDFALHASLISNGHPEALVLDKSEGGAGAGVVGVDQQDALEGGFGFAVEVF